MDRLVYIFHRSAMVQIGLSEILRKHFKCKIYLFTQFSDFQNSLHSTSGLILLLCDEETAISEPYLQLLHSAPEINSFTIVNQYSKTINTQKKNSILLSSSQDEIYEKVKGAFEYPTEKGNQDKSLTNREIEVLKLVALGFANKEIADKLFISTHTVISHRKNITEKLGVKSISGLTVYAIINDYIDTSKIDVNDLI